MDITEMFLYRNHSRDLGGNKIKQFVMLGREIKKREGQRKGRGQEEGKGNGSEEAKRKGREKRKGNEQMKYLVEMTLFCCLV